MKRAAFCIAIVLFAPVACAIHADMAQMAESKARAVAANQPPPALFASSR